MRISLGILLLIPTLAGAQTRPVFKPRPFQPAVVKFLEPGQAPLSPLRYALKGEQNTTVSAKGEMELAQGTGGESRTVAFPSITTPVTLGPQGKKLKYTWRQASFTTTPEDTQTRHLVAALEGSWGELVMADATRGLISNILIRPGPKDPMTDGMMETRSLMAMEFGKGIVGTVIVPLPEEPIGVGGRWQVERVVQRGTLSFKLFHTFTVVARKGNAVTLSYRLGGAWEPGSGFREEEVKVGASGSGTCTLDLTLPLPTACDDDLTVKATITAPSGAQTFQTTRVGTHVESR